MAQRVTTPQGTKRRHPGNFSPPGLHADESENRRPQYPPPPPPGAMSGLQAPQMGVAVLTIDMFREYQRQVATSFERHGSLIAQLQERVQTMEGRVQSLEEAEDMAIDAVRQIRNTIMPRVDQHQESLDQLSTAVTRQNTIIDTFADLGQEMRATQNRDVARPNQLAWRPGPLGGPGDQTKSIVEDLKAQITRSFASLAEHDGRLRDTDTRFEAYDRHLLGHERRIGEHDAHLTAHDRYLGDLNTHFADYNGRLVNHVTASNERLEALHKGNEQLTGRVTILDQRTENGLSPAQISAIMQNHQQRLESLEQNLQQHIKDLQEAQAKMSSSPHSQENPSPAQNSTAVFQSGLESQEHADEANKAFENPQSPNGHGKAPQNQDRCIDYDPEFERLGGLLDAMDKRIIPLEQRMDLVERDFEKFSHSSNTPESIPKDQAPEEESQYEIMRQTDFQRQEDLTSLRSNEESQLLMQLFSEKDKCEDACYTVQRACVHMWSYLLCRSRKDERLASDFWKRDDWLNYPTMLELDRNAAMPKGRYFPRFVYEIGEIFNRKVVTKYNGRQATHRSTGYHLVVDVTKPEKSLWLIYRYQEASADSQGLRQSITYKQDSFWHPFASVCEYDIAMLFERFEDWKGSDTPVGSYTSSRKLVRQTAALIRPTFIEPDLQELKDAIRRGWEAGGKTGALRR
ncbi:hypothetical protein F4808DRAFT_210668 [Astrocystis sublimbata]|nr:hypothetical protein F4808DRAFT_210668 [Astrocystis sublimbata]